MYDSRLGNLQNWLRYPTTQPGETRVRRECNKNKFDRTWTRKILNQRGTNLFKLRDKCVL